MKMGLDLPKWASVFFMVVLGGAVLFVIIGITLVCFGG